MKLIDLEVLLEKLEWLEEYDRIVFHDVKNSIDEVPTVEAVSVVRCKDCKYARNGWLSKTLSCDIWGDKFSPEDYCSTGKRRDEYDH